jgi:hypothetical protein
MIASWIKHAIVGAALREVLSLNAADFLIRRLHLEHV